MGRSQRSTFGTFFSGFLPFLLLLAAGCAVAPVVPNPKPAGLVVGTSPEKTKALLEKIQGSHPDYAIRAVLTPKGSGTEVHLVVYTKTRVHMAVGGFQEPAPHKRLYPDCNRWFNLTRNFDPACGGGPYLGTANLVFADGMVFGALFDLFQAGRYPFAYTTVMEPDRVATRSVLKEIGVTGTGPDSRRTPSPSVRVASR